MTQPRVAYFSMEIALEPRMPTYGGGMGVLAGDILRSAADLKVPMVAVTLLHRKGYFQQKLDPSGWQQEQPAAWVVQEFLEEMPQRVSVVLEGKAVSLRAWRYSVKGIDKFIVPVYLLDADVPENAQTDRELTHLLYGGDAAYRLRQEIILGIGGVRMLRVLGYQAMDRFHMNEGHAAFLTTQLLEEQIQKSGRPSAAEEDIDQVKQLCVFTTHTPVPAGHDQFPLDLVKKVLGPSQAMPVLERLSTSGVLNVTTLALTLSRYVNAVSRRHAEVSREMFPTHSIEAITNGVHALTWVAPSFKELFDRSLPGWRRDNVLLRNAVGIPKPEVWSAHAQAKRKLLDLLSQKGNPGFGDETLTIGFARRAATYKRGDLLLRDTERLRRICKNAGPLQVVFAGKAHPHDKAGKELIQRIVQAKERLKSDIRIAYLENYDMELGKIITAGVDVWLNNPQPPLEASGTSGMKAALNGVPNFSILDGWWVEGHVEGVTGWAIGGDSPFGGSSEERSSRDAVLLYDKLEQVILPMFYRDRDRFIEIMRHAIALNGSFFNTQRLVEQYVTYAYFSGK